MTDPEVPASEIAEVVPLLGLSETHGGDGQPWSMSWWQAERLARPNVPGLPTVGIWRVRVCGRSVILKVLREPVESSAWAGHPDPGHPFYWRREAEVFTHLTAWLDDRRSGQIAPGVRMPCCYAVIDRPDGAVAIWMEDVDGTPASQWNLQRYGRFAGQLADFHAERAPVPGGDVPGGDVPRVAGRQWLRTYLERRDPVGDVLQKPEIWQHPRVRAVVDPRRSEDFVALWRRRYDYLAEVEAQPEVLCHLDMHPLNLFDVHGRTVLIDWAFCGIGGLGEDLGALAIDAVSDFHLHPDELAPLFEILVTRYAAASAYDEHTVRRAVASAALVRYAWLIPALVTALTEDWERINGRPREQAAPVWGAICHFLLDLAAEPNAPSAGHEARR